jgi:hypothetical protein
MTEEPRFGYVSISPLLQQFDVRPCWLHPAKTKTTNLACIADQCLGTALLWALCHIQLYVCHAEKHEVSQFMCVSVTEGGAHST